MKKPEAAMLPVFLFPFSPYLPLELAVSPS
ncbi:hypothetical protein G159_17810 [Planococcus glaciei CHR43]|nr:hypothetical protein G159_17810 [Planococcus glaciei CHR43]